MTSSPLLVMTGVSRTYGDAATKIVALDQADLRIEAGEMVAVMGPSGSGKSTLLTIAGGLESPTSGSVTVDGVNIGELDGAGLAGIRRQRIGYVFQGYNLLSSMTAAENVAAPLELDGVSAKAARAEAISKLEAVGLGDRGDAFPDSLSGGEQQRVAIARALVGERRLVLADEPTGALDSASGTSVMTLMRQACGTSSAVVVVTHNADVASWADRVIELHDGRILRSATR